MNTLFEDLEPSAAVLSPCGTYRYTLYREWDDGKCIAWLMLNPSTADATINDHTIRKCMGFSERWGYARMIVVNLFALRSTDPRALSRNTDPVGPENDWHINRAFEESREVVCAWGCQQHLTTAALRIRVQHVMGLVSAHHSTVCLGLRNDGGPRHPLMVPYAQERMAFVCPAPSANAARRHAAN